MHDAEVLGVLKALSIEHRELDIGSFVDRVPSTNAVEFLRYVGANKPVIVTDGLRHWPALRLWTDAYLLSKVGDCEVTVATTPNGRADAPAAGPDGGALFALPHEQRMPFRSFLKLLYSTRQQTLEDEALEDAAPSHSPSDPGSPATEGTAAAAGAAGAVPSAVPPVIPYLQAQNGNLTSELPALLDDVEAGIPWATEAFGAPPEAVNFWMGDARSATSLHKDPYENLYAVVSGTKTFRLLPPCDAYRLRLRQYDVAAYRPAAAEPAAEPAAGSGGPEEEERSSSRSTGGGLVAEPVQPAQRVLWSSVSVEECRRACEAGGAHEQPLPEQPGPAGRHGAAAPQAPPGPGSSSGGRPGDLLRDRALPPPLSVTVGAGELLYLPALWWHQVEQQEPPGGRVLAVNYWYDMKFDFKQAAFRAVEALAVGLGLNEPPPAGT